MGRQRSQGRGSAANRPRRFKAPTSRRGGIFHYTVEENPGGVKRLFRSMRIPINPNRLSKHKAAMILAKIIQKKGEAGLKLLADIHPDKELILKSSLSNFEDDIPFNQVLYNADSGGKRMVSEKTSNILIIAGASILGLSLLAILIKE